MVFIMNKIKHLTNNHILNKFKSIFSFSFTLFSHKLVALFIAIPIIFVACNDQQKEEPNKNDTIQLEDTLSEEGLYTPMPDGRQMIDIKELRSSKSTLEPEQMAKFIPNKINNFSHGSLNFYQADDGYASVSTVYRLSATSGIELRIFDNGPTAPLLDERFFKVMPQEVNMTTREIRRENGIGFLVMSNNFSTANLSVLYNNRINIIYKTYGMTEETNKPEEFLDLIDINKLLELLN